MYPYFSCVKADKLDIPTSIIHYYNPLSTECRMIEQGASVLENESVYSTLYTDIRGLIKTTIAFSVFFFHCKHPGELQKSYFGDLLLLSFDGK